MVKKIILGWLSAMVPTAATTAWMVKAAYIQRGYQAIGGEWMLLPFVVLMLVWWTTAKIEAERRYEEATRFERRNANWKGGWRNSLREMYEDCGF